MQKTHSTHVDHNGNGHTPSAHQKLANINLPKPLYSVKEACELLQCSNATVYSLIKKGILPLPIKIGPRKVAFLGCDLEIYLGSRPRADIAVDSLDLGGEK